MGKDSNGKGGLKEHKPQWVSKAHASEETTVVLTGLPKTLNAEILLRLLEADYKGYYDFFYLPMDVDQMENTGLAYINFRDHDTAVACQRSFQGRTVFGAHTSERPCKAQWSSIQGYDANIVKHQKSEWLQKNIPEDCKPMAFDHHGTRLPILDVFTPNSEWKVGRTWRSGSTSHDGKHDKWSGWYTDTYDDWHRSENGYTGAKWWNGGNNNNSWWHDEWHSSSKTGWRETDGSYYDSSDKDATANFDSESQTGLTSWECEGTQANEESGDTYDSTGSYARQVFVEEPEVEGQPQSKDISPANGQSSAQESRDSSEEATTCEPPESESLPTSDDAAPAPPSLLSGLQPCLNIRKYACPNCNEIFAKWSACQHHLVSDPRCAPCIKADTKLPSDFMQLQETCKTVAQGLPTHVTLGKAAEDAAKEKIRRFQ
mmetsp:Transcript_53595/g.124827  ORF Transcript_53595/g.124827 Transcript_53595/m.124827 type:complete len:430 (+) Transcript_53595:66-1355(+)